MMKYQCIFEHQQEYAVKCMCSAFDVSESGYYSWRKRPKNQRASVDEYLLQEIEQIFHANRSVYGSPRIHAALHMALLQRQPGAELIHHSDRGSEYASSRYQTLLREHHIQVSMSKKGDCCDNAMIESVRR